MARLPNGTTAVIDEEFVAEAFPPKSFTERHPVISTILGYLLIILLTGICIYATGGFGVALIAGIGIKMGLGLGFLNTMAPLAASVISGAILTTSLLILAATASVVSNIVSSLFRCVFSKSYKTGEQPEPDDGLDPESETKKSPFHQLGGPVARNTDDTELAKELQRESKEVRLPPAIIIASEDDQPEPQFGPG